MVPTNSIQHIDNDNINVPGPRKRLPSNMNEMFPFDSRHNEQSYSKAGVKSFENLPQLCEKEGPVEQESLQDFRNLDALFLDTPCPFQSHEHRIQELTNIESEYSKLIKPHIDPKANDHNQSTDAIIRLGGKRFIQSCSIKDLARPSQPYGASFSSLSDQEAKDVQLIQNLLLSAEKVCQKQFECSTKLLDWCDVLSSSSGNPVQRLVHYFSKALREKIARETGRISFPGSRKNYASVIITKMMSLTPTMISVYQNLPFFQAGQFAGVQALVDGVAGATKVHIIDLSLKNGVQTTILMQALASRASCPIEHLKVTAIATKLKHKFEEMGNHLKSFAESINLCFSFHVAMVEDMLDFKQELLELDPNEALAVYSSYGLWSMISQPDRLESLMKVVKSINPCVMVVSETAANLNSPNFVNRFIEALFYYGAIFDSLEDCMDREDENRTITESVYFGNGIMSVVASEDDERAIRLVNIDVWRKFFVRFGMKEIDLSMSSLYQAYLMVEKFSCGSSCTFDMDGSCLIIGWKGSPIQFLSAWKFP